MADGQFPTNPEPRSLLQMAQTAMGGAGQDWAPSWVKEQLPMNLAWYNANRGDQAPIDASGDISAAFVPMSGGGLGSGAGKLASYYNPANWGPPPAITEPLAARPLGYFPSQFAQGGSDPNDKFWSQKSLLEAYNQKYPGGQMPGTWDERPNTRNWRLLGGDPGDFMFLGHHINQGKMREDFRQGTDPGPGQEGTSRPRMGWGFPRYGTEFPASFSYGNDRTLIGLPGQLETWATGW